MGLPVSEARDKAKTLGLTRYFTGKPCKHGHVCERFVSTRSCLKCNRDASDAFYKKHAGKRLLVRKRNYYKCREEYLAVQRTRSRKVRDLIAVLRQELPELLEEIGI